MNFSEKINAFFQGKDKRGLKFLGIAAAAFAVLCLMLGSLMLPGTDRVFPVYINEVLASNTVYPDPDGRCSDYIELYNSADYPVDLSGFELGDIGGNKRYVFPAGSIMQPESYLVIYCDKTITDGTYAPFGISRAGGENIYLLTTNRAIADSLVTLATDMDQSMVRLADGSWGVSDMVTPGRSNDDVAQPGREVYNPEVSPVRITELTAANTGYSREAGTGCDWVELHNTSRESVDISGYTLSDNTSNDKYSFPKGTVLPPDAYLVVCCSDGTDSLAVAPFNLSQKGGEYVVLKNHEGRIIEMVCTQPMSGVDSLALVNGFWTVTEEASPGFANTLDGREAYLQTIGAREGTIVISEVMAADQAILADCFGDFSDWVELYNSGETAVELAGWYLSDDHSETMKWAIPEIILQPGQRIVIFCSGRDGVYDGELHASFSLSASGEALVLSSYAGICMDSVTFGASDRNQSFILDPADSQLILTAYPTPGYSNDMEGYESFCAADVAVGELAIWEVMTSNDWYLPQALGACYDWVELRNTSDEAISLGDYSLTDDSDASGKYTLPDRTIAPGESFVVILSGDSSLSTKEYAHAPFSLNAMEDQLFLYRNDTLVDHVALSQIPLGYSYGRMENVGGFFYMKPSPQKANNPGSRLISAMPTSDIAPGVYATETSLQVSLEAVGEIYYTTDGSVPDASSERYEAPIQVDKTTVIRAVSLEDGKMSSDIYTATFIVQEPHDIPVLSLVMDPQDLWGPDGIYKYDIAVKEEKRSANLAYSGEDGSFSLDCEISLHGATTVTAFAKKSFTLRFHDNYDGILEYDVFGDGEVTKFRSLILRTSHESVYSTQMRDALMGQAASECSDTVVAQKFRYVALYINGEYWGLYALREHHSEEHFASYMDVPVASVEKPVKFALSGTTLYQAYQFCEKNSCKSDENYAYMQTLVDVNSYADWIILEAYTGNIDINENMRYYYCAVDGLWHCALVDVDLGMFSHNGIESVTGAWHHGIIAASLMENEQFQRLVAQRMAEMLGGTLSDESMTGRVDTMSEIIRNEMVLDAQRWGYTIRNWESAVANLRDYCDGRALELINSFCDYVDFTEAEKMEYFGELLK